MNMFFDADVSRYHSPSQKARVWTETWTAKNVFCPRCGNDMLSQNRNNTPVRDFRCPVCQARYEQKSRKRKFSPTVLGSDYKKLHEALISNTNPDYFFLVYDLPSLSVRDLFVVPKHFFHPGIVVARRPLPPTAKRPGWVGCNILLSEIPCNGKIYIVRDGMEQDKETVMKNFRDTLFLENQTLSARGWLLDVWNCINHLPDSFNLKDVYAFEPLFLRKYPDNQHIKDKIRQQLQVLRDKSVIDFNGKGRYSRIR